MMTKDYAKDYRRRLKADPRVSYIELDGNRHWVFLEDGWCYPVSDPAAGWGFGNDAFDSWKDACESLDRIAHGTHC